MNSSYTHEIIEPITHLPIYFKVFQNSYCLIPSHWHSDLEILWIKKGGMHIVLKERSYDLLENDLFIVNSNELHSTRTQKDTSVWMLQIPSGFLDGFLPFKEQIWFKEYFSSSKLSQNDIFSSLCLQMTAMENSFSGQKKGYELEFTSLMLHYLYLLYRNFSREFSSSQKGKADKSFDRIKLVLDEINRDYMHPFPLKKAAGTASLSPEYFCRLFRQYTGTTFLEYINLIRLSHIHDDLLNSRCTVTELLQKHGFTNYKVFCRMFKKAYGCTPKELRKNTFSKIKNVL